MKRIALLVLIFAIIAIFCGCTGNGKVNEQDLEKSQMDNRMFMIISDEWYGYIIIDKQTKVMYWESNGGYNSGTLTLLVNPDGTPRIWKGQ